MGRPADERVCHCCGTPRLSRLGMRMLFEVSDAGTVDTVALAQATGMTPRNLRRLIAQWADLLAYGPKRGNRKTYHLSRAGKEAVERLREGGAT